MRWLALVAVLSCSAPPRSAVPAAPEPLRPEPIGEALPKVGPLPDLPARIPHTFEPARYAVELTIDPKAPFFSGTVTIDGTLAEPAALLWFHSSRLTVHRVTATRDGRSQPLVAKLPGSELLALQAGEPLAAGAWTITIAYTGEYTDLTRPGPEGSAGVLREHDTDSNADYVFTQFEPDFARTAFPCIDEPDRKVPWQLTIVAPEQLEVASNAPVRRTTATGDGTKRVELEPTKPVPSYLVAFAVGPFEVFDAGRSRSGIPIRILALRGRRTVTAHAVAATAGILDRIENYLGVPFGYPKLDIVTVPATPYWWFAMENPGLVTIDVDALHDPPKWDRVIGHEIAHHWFGNLVTLAWWDDLWLNESFAEWVSQASAGTEPLAQLPQLGPALVAMPVNDPRHAFPSHNGVLKGQALLTRLRGYLGAQTFHDVLVRYLTAHAHGTVTTESFLAALRTADAGVVSFANSYIRASEMPPQTELECTGKQHRVVVSEIAQDSTIVCFAYDRDGKRADTCTQVTKAKPTIALGTKRCPRWFFGESLSLFFGAQLNALRDAGWDQLTERERERIAELVTNADVPLRWSFMTKLAQATGETTTSLVATALTTMRENIDDVATRDAFDGWVRTSYKGRTVSFERTPALALLLAVAGDSSLVDEARAIEARGRSEDVAVLHARKALARTDKQYMARLLDRWLAASVAQQYEYDLPLRRSPLLFEVLRDNATRLKAHAVYALDLLGDLCHVPADELTAVGLAIDPVRGKTVVDPVYYGRCAVERRKTTDTLRTYFVAKPAP